MKIFYEFIGVRGRYTVKIYLHSKPKTRWKVSVLKNESKKEFIKDIFEHDWKYEIV